MTSREKARLNVMSAVRLTQSALIHSGYIDAGKARDPIEPGVERKDKMEGKMFRASMRHFRWQKAKIREILETYYPDRKTIYTAPPLVWEQLFEDPVYMAEVMRILTAAAQDGVLLFDELVALPIDYTLVNIEAAAWAREHAGDLITGNEELGLKGIDTVTKEALQQSLDTFVNTPGYTIGDVMKPLLETFSESRAWRIATTEITTAYSEADKIAGDELAEQWTDVPIVKTWFTNNDDIVRECPICWPNHMIRVLKGNPFPSGHMRPIGHIGCRCWINTTTDISGIAELWDGKPIEEDTNA